MSSSSLRIPNFTAARMLIVGDVMLDRYWQGNASRISPEAPVPVVKVNQKIERPGGAANVALNVKALGAEQVILLGITGNDEEGRTLEQLLKNREVECHFLKTDDKPTTCKLRVLSQNHQLLRMDFEEIQDETTSSALLPQLAEWLEKSDILVLSDYDKGVIRDPLSWIKLAKEKQIPVIVDPKGNNFQKYRGATLLTPNLTEFEQIVGPCEDEKTIEQRGFELIRKLDLMALLITRGAQGMSLLTREGIARHFPAYAREVFDVTGAGDTVIATLATALAVKENLSNAVALANIAAGIAVGRLGAAAISPSDIKHFLKMTPPRERKIIALEQAQEVTSSWNTRELSSALVLLKNEDLSGHLILALSQLKQAYSRICVSMNTKITEIKTETVNFLQAFCHIDCVDMVVAHHPAIHEKLNVTAIYEFSENRLVKSEIVVL